jgi:hypothetical protein
MKKINNYNDLILEKIRLQEELRTQKTILKGEINSVKHNFDPLIHAVSLMKNVSKKFKSITSFIKGKRSDHSK